LKQVRLLLPSPLDDHCSSAVLQNGRLVLLADSPVWASRLRYLSHNLQRQLSQKGFSIRRIQSRVSIPEDLVKHQERIRPITPLSQANSDLLRSVAESMENQELRNALLRLSRHKAR
ncbi:MAG: DciA family protein, partial [Pseudomonadota bacterium]